MKKLLCVAVLMILVISAVPAATPLDPAAQTMYANAYSIPVEGVTVSFTSYNQDIHPLRLYPSNALNEFDAQQGDSAFVDKFFALGARAYTNYTFNAPFGNVDGVADIEFAEVTWGNWHTEAAKVYLTNAYVRDMNGNVVPYGATDDGKGYFAGIVWNKIGILGLTDAARELKTQEYATAMGINDRIFMDNKFKRIGNIGISEFDLPEEVVCADGITLVDITADVFGMVDGLIPDAGTLKGVPSTYSSGAGKLVTVPGLDPSIYTAVPGGTGNTDGYDLDAIKVYRCPPSIGNASATGMGLRIKPKGTWFMYNTYNGGLDGPSATYDIQAGNPNGLTITNKIGTFTIINNGSGSFTATANIDKTITINGWIYEINVLGAQLAVSDTMNFTANPGMDDNQDFGIPFSDANGNFLIFAHFTVEFL
ncbi:MAG: hypothetical protein ACYC0V_08935 [Armatimonadota bacterium]